MGCYLIGIISDEDSFKGGRTISYNYKINKITYENEDFTTASYYKNNDIGDTIIIKFLPDDPEKSMIIEDKEYKSCYGIPPADGWKELPNCE